MIKQNQYVCKIADAENSICVVINADNKQQCNDILQNDKTLYELCRAHNVLHMINNVADVELIKEQIDVVCDSKLLYVSINNLPVHNEAIKRHIVYDDSKFGSNVENLCKQIATVLPGFDKTNFATRTDVCRRIIKQINKSDALAIKFIKSSLKLSKFDAEDIIDAVKPNFTKCVEIIDVDNVLHVDIALVN